MKNALILHGTDFDKDQKQHLNNWFPWLKTELEKLDYEVWVPELPEAWHPNLNRYWNFLKHFDFNSETILIGHSSGGATVCGLLHKLPPENRIKLAISVAGFYKDEGWNCEGLFSEPYDWGKIKKQSEKIIVIASDDDPYVKLHHAQYFASKLGIEPKIMHGQQHFNLEVGPRYKEFPELLEIIRKNVN